MKAQFPSWAKVKSSNILVEDHSDPFALQDCSLEEEEQRPVKWEWPSLLDDFKVWGKFVQGPAAYWKNLCDRSCNLTHVNLTRPFANEKKHSEENSSHIQSTLKDHFVITKFTTSIFHQRICNWMRVRVCFCMVVPPCVELTDCRLIIRTLEALGNSVQLKWFFPAFPSYICHNFNMDNSNLLFTGKKNVISTELFLSFLIFFDFKIRPNLILTCDF